MKKEGIAVTNAGKLKSKYIIHTDTKYKTKEWLHPVELCLKKAEEHGFKSVAFPTLGISKYNFLTSLIRECSGLQMLRTFITACLSCRNIRGVKI